MIKTVQLSKFCYVKQKIVSKCFQTIHFICKIEAFHTHSCCQPNLSHQLLPSERDSQLVLLPLLFPMLSLSTQQTDFCNTDHITTLSYLKPLWPCFVFHIKSRLFSQHDKQGLFKSLSVSLPLKAFLALSLPLEQVAHAHAMSCLCNTLRIFPLVTVQFLNHMTSPKRPRLISQLLMKITVFYCFIFFDCVNFPKYFLVRYAFNEHGSELEVFMVMSPIKAIAERITCDGHALKSD